MARQSGTERDVFGLRHPLAVLAVSIIVLLAMLSNHALADGGVDEGLGEAELTDEHGLAFPKLGSQLNGLAEEYGAAYGARPSEGDSAARAGVGNTAATLHGLSITFDGDAEKVVRVIEKQGGEVRHVLDGYIEAYVPSTGLAALARVGNVTWARELATPFSLKGRVISQGVGAHLANAWHSAGIRGQGMKIGVIDFATNVTRDGFSGLPSLLGSDLPRTVVARCYTKVRTYSANLNDCTSDGGSNHGTVVAETVMDMAPDASLYIANPISWADLRQTTEWMYTQGVQVIVYSAGWTFHGPPDGTSPFHYAPLNTVKWAADQGIVWVNAVGNSHGDSWFGAFADADNDDLHEWTGGRDEYQTFDLSAGELATVFMRWDDIWDGANKDLALIVVKDPGTVSETEVARSNDAQSGSRSQHPFEAVDVRASSKGRYGIKVQHVSGAEPGWMQLVVWNEIISHPTDGYSIMSPSDSPHPGVLAVGGVMAQDTSRIFNFSGRGPTPDGRIKPDIVGAACTATVSDGTYFCGTSAAAPHVGGLAALALYQPIILLVLDVLTTVQGGT